MAEPLTLHLDSIHHLFNAPEFDPFSPHPRSLSGVDSIIQHLKPSIRHQEKFTVTILLPAELMTPELPERLRWAIRQFCEQKIKEMEHELVVLRWRARKGLRIGLGILALFLFLAAAVSRADFLPAGLSTLLSEALTIIGSVSLWHPAEMLLFDWSPFVRQRRIYEFIAALEFEVKAEDLTPSPSLLA